MHTRPELRPPRPRRKLALVAAAVALAVAGGGALAYAAAAPARPTVDQLASAELVAAVDPGTNPAGDTGAAGPAAQVRECVRQHRAANDRPGVRDCLKGLRGLVRARGALGRAVHGDLIVRNKAGAYEPVTFDRGTVASKADGTVSLDRPDGVKVVVKVDGGTTYRGITGLDQLRTGAPAMVVSRNGTALVVVQRPPGGTKKTSAEPTGGNTA